MPWAMVSSSVVTQPPRSSALLKADASLLAARDVHSGSTASPLLSAEAWHAKNDLAYLAAPFVLEPPQRLAAGSAADWPAQARTSAAMKAATMRPLFMCFPSRAASPVARPLFIATMAAEASRF